MPKMSNYVRTRIELLHKQALHPAGMFRSLKSGGLLVSLASVSLDRESSRNYKLLASWRIYCAQKTSKVVDAKSIYRSTDAKNVMTHLSGEEVFLPTIIAKT